MKIIDLLNKIASGEINEDIEIEYQNGYNFEYCNIRNFFDRYIVDKENLNQEIKLVKSLEEENKIPEKLPYYSMEKIQKAKNKDEWREKRITLLEKRVEDLHIKMNELLDYLKSKGE